MSDNPKASQPVAEGLPPVCPVLLKQAREACGVHLAGLASALKVPVRKLEALEAGRYDELPDLTFARALASSACRQLKIDPQPVLAQIPVVVRQGMGASPQRMKTPFKTPADAPAPAAFAKLLRPVPLVVTGLLVAAVALYSWPDDEPALRSGAMSGAVQQSPGGDVSAAAVLPKEDPPGGLQALVGIDTATPVVSEAPDILVAGLPPIADSSRFVHTGATLSSSSPATLPSAGTQAVTVPDAPTSASRSILNLTASGDVWVEVTDSRAETLLQRMLKAGDSVDLMAAPPYAVVIGRTDVVQVRVRGELLDVTPYARNNVARFEVK